MNCPNCGTLNNENSKFCMRCGYAVANSQPQYTNQNTMSQTTTSNVESIQTMNTNNSYNQNINSEKNVALNSFEKQPTQNVNVNNSQNKSNNKVSIMGYFSIILAVILKPFTAIKQQLNKFNQIKASSILSLLISGIATIVNLISTMISSVRVETCSWFSKECTVTWTWENLKELNYIEIIGKNFLIYLAVIVAIAAVYYIASLIIKKKVNFSRLLGISALSVAPILVCSMVLSPLLSIVYAPLGLGVTIVGAVYTIIILYEAMNSEILVEGNAKYYFNLCCASILIIAAYYLLVNLLMSSITGGLDSYLNLFG